MEWRFVSHKDYLEAIYEGERSFSAGHEFLSRAQEEVLKNGHNRILIDATSAKGKYEDSERVKIAEKIRELFRYGYKIAALEKPENINRVMEKTLLEHSINFLALGEKEKALKWLLGD